MSAALMTSISQLMKNEKLSKYSGLRVELAKMWNCECVVIPTVILLDKFTQYLKDHLTMRRIDSEIVSFEKIEIM